MSDEDTAARLRRIRRNRLKDWMNAVLAAGGNLWVGADAAQSGQPLIAASAFSLSVVTQGKAREMAGFNHQYMSWTEVPK